MLCNVMLFLFSHRPQRPLLHRKQSRTHSHTQTHNTHYKRVRTSTFVSNASRFSIIILQKTNLTPFIHGKLSINVTLNKSVRS